MYDEIQKGITAFRADAAKHGPESAVCRFADYFEDIIARDFRFDDDEIAYCCGAAIAAVMDRAALLGQQRKEGA